MKPYLIKKIKTLTTALRAEDYPVDAKVKYPYDMKVLLIISLKDKEEVFEILKVIPNAKRVGDV